MVLVQKQTYKSMEQNRKPRIKPLHLWSINRDKEVKNIQRRKDNLQQVVLGEQPATCKFLLPVCLQIAIKYKVTSKMQFHLI